MKFNKLVRDAVDNTLEETGYPTEEVDYNLGIEHDCGVAFYGEIDIRQVLDRIDTTHIDVDLIYTMSERGDIGARIIESDVGYPMKVDVYEVDMIEAVVATLLDSIEQDEFELTDIYDNIHSDDEFYDHVIDQIYELEKAIENDVKLLIDQVMVSVRRVVSDKNAKNIL